MIDDSSSGRLFEKIFKSRKEEDKQIRAEEEILSLVEEGREKGLIEDDTQDIIENVFDFDDTVAYEIMTHRRDMVTLEDTDTLEQVVKVAISSGHSRIPVYKDDIDNIVGILYVKDLLRFVGREAPKDFYLPDITRNPMFVPRTKDLHSLYVQMTKEKTQIAIVVDEYGGTEGIVTLEDLIEDILGSIQDEYDDEDEEITKISEDKFTVDGSTPVDDVSELTGVEIDDSDCETIAGFILDKLGRIPKGGERPEITIPGLRLKVLETEERRITKVLLEKTENIEEL